VKNTAAAVVAEVADVAMAAAAAVAVAVVAVAAAADAGSSRAVRTGMLLPGFGVSTAEPGSATNGLFPGFTCSNVAEMWTPSGFSNKFLQTDACFFGHPTAVSMGMMIFWISIPFQRGSDRGMIGRGIRKRRGHDDSPATSGFFRSKTKGKKISGFYIFSPIFLPLPFP
jgi:hypothetical protein